MKTSDFDYFLPEEYIAQTPLINRSDSKLMILDRNNGNILHENFYNILNYFKSGEVLVLNDTLVIPARLIGYKSDTLATIEILLLKDLGSDRWEVLSKPQKRLHVGSVIIFHETLLKGEVVEILNDGITHIKLIYQGILLEILEKLGTMPLPPYIHEKLKEQNRYQTIYAKHPGSAAAPTAGLHFTKELLDQIKNKGVIITYVTLHVGLGTFRPVTEEDALKHEMHTEYYEMNDETADILNLAKKEKRNIYAVGTTSVRTLETIMDKYNEFKSCSGDTNIFIYPGFKFKAIDGMITNFHLPKSTLLMLVSAFSSKENILNAYNEAIVNHYRFFSFGDAMFIRSDINEN